MAWIDRRKKYLYGGVILVFLLSTMYACIRQAKSDTASSTASPPAAPAAAPAPTPAPAQAPAAATPAAPVQAPAQAKEKDSSAALSTVSPAPSTDLPKYEDPTKLPEPGPPYGKENRNADVVLKDFPTHNAGEVDWVKAFKENMIKPHESLDLAKPPVPPFMFDIEIPAVGSMPNVIFPHFPHTFWLDCGNCHPAIFQMKKGGNPISMVKIVNGEFCGRCHGRIAFPIANCTRCHVKPKT